MERPPGFTVDESPLLSRGGLRTPSHEFQRDMIQPRTAPALTPSPWLQTPAQLSGHGPLEWALETWSPGTAPSLLDLPAFLSSVLWGPLIYMPFRDPKLSLK